MTAPPSPIQRSTFALLFLAATVVLGLALWPFWTQLFLAFFLASVFSPTYNRLRGKMLPWIAASLTCLLITLCIFFPLLFCIGAVSAEIPGVIQLARDNNILVLLQQNLQESDLVHRAGALLANFGVRIEIDRLSSIITELSTSVGLFLYNQVSSWATNIVRFVLQFGIVIVGVFFLLIEFNRLIAFLQRLSPLPASQNRFLIERFATISGALLIGNTLSGLIQGICGGIFFAAMGLISPILWGAVMGVVAFMPIVGIGLVLLPTALILALKGHGWQAIATLIFYLVLTFVVDYLFKPRFVGEQANLPPLLVLLSIIGGMSLSGIMGIIYGPLAVTAFLTLADMYVLDYQPYIDHRDKNGYQDSSSKS